MTIRHCFRHADLVSCALFFSFYISLNISVSLRNLIIFSASQLFYSSVLMSPQILYFFLLSIHWGQFCRQCFIVNLRFLHAGCCSFLDIKCPWVNLVCPIRCLCSPCIFLRLQLTSVALLLSLSRCCCHLYVSLPIPQCFFCCVCITFVQSYFILASMVYSPHTFLSFGALCSRGKAPPHTHTCALFLPTEFPAASAELFGVPKVDAPFKRVDFFFSIVVECFLHQLQYVVSF